jgi:A/G-specific adenine glycosylase
VRTSSPTAIRRKLLTWFRKEKRRLPWRGTRDPYRIWVSEVMLQQTTVAAVLGRYKGFLHRFPDLATLARAREDSVLAAWSGLGYYARARNLHLAAREVLRRYGGRLPDDAMALRRLPGFGDYTAAAVASLAFGASLPAADANVTRVVSRLFGIKGDSGSRAHRDAVLSAAWRLLPRRRPGDMTAGLMDLGQSICTARDPSCPQCPLRRECEALRRGNPERYPRRKAKPKARRVWFAAACVLSGGRALLSRRRESILKGLWEFPCGEGASLRQARRRLEEEARRHGVALGSSAPIGEASHTVLNRRLRIRIYRGRIRRAPLNSGAFRWFTPQALARAAIPTLTRKIGAAVGFLPTTAPARRFDSRPPRGRASGRASHD